MRDDIMDIWIKFCICLLILNWLNEVCYILIGVSIKLKVQLFLNVRAPTKLLFALINDVLSSISTF